MPDRLLYQSEAEQLVLERGLVVAEPEVPFFRFSGASGIQSNKHRTKSGKGVRHLLEDLRYLKTCVLQGFFAKFCITMQGLKERRRARGGFFGSQLVTVKRTT